MKSVPLKIVFPLLLTMFFSSAAAGASQEAGRVTGGQVSAEAEIRERLAELRQLAQATDASGDTKVRIAALAEAAENNLGAQHPLTTEALLFAGGYFWDHGQNRRATEFYRRALTGIENRPEGEQSEFATILFRIATWTEKPEEKISFFGRAVAHRSRFGGSLDDETISSLNQYLDILSHNPDEERYLALVPFLISAFSRGEISVGPRTDELFFKFVSRHQGGTWSDQKARLEVVEGYLKAFEAAAGPMEGWKPELEKRYDSLLLARSPIEVVKYRQKVWESRVRNFGEQDPRTISAMMKVAALKFSTSYLTETGQRATKEEMQANLLQAKQFFGRTYNAVQALAPGVLKPETRYGWLWWSAAVQLENGFVEDGIKTYEQILSELENEPSKYLYRTVSLNLYPVLRHYKEQRESTGKANPSLLLNKEQRESTGKADPSLLLTFQKRFLKRFGPFHPWTVNLSDLLVSFYRESDSMVSGYLEEGDKVIEAVLAAADQIPVAERTPEWKFLREKYEKVLLQSADPAKREKRLLARLAAVRQKDAPELLEETLHDLIFFYNAVKRDPDKAAAAARELAESGADGASTGWLYQAFLRMQKKEFLAANEMVERFFSTAGKNDLETKEGIARSLRYTILRELGRDEPAEADFAFLYAKIRAGRSSFHPSSLVSGDPALSKAFKFRDFIMTSSFSYLPAGVSEFFLVRFRAEWEKEFGSDDPVLKFVDKTLERQRRLVQERRPKG